MIGHTAVYSIAMKQLASFASLGELKNNAVFTLGEMLGVYNDIHVGLSGMYILRLFKFLLLAEV